MTTTSAPRFHNPAFPDHITTPGQDTRNIIDHYKGWDNLLIRDHVAATAFPLVVVLENFAHDFNIGTSVRNANAFGASKVIILGRGSWDRRGAVGTHHYMNIERTHTLDGLYDQYKNDGYQIVAIDNVDGAVTLRDHQWNPKTVLVMGQEDIGVSNDTLRHADACVSIPMFGSVRSLNVGTAGGIIMHDYATSITR